MPEAATYDMAALTQTRVATNPVNLDKIREFGEAMMLGVSKRISRRDECDTCAVATNYAYSPLNGLVDWISQDYNKNSTLLKILVGEIATGFSANVDYVFNSEQISQYSQKPFADDITSMLTSIRGGMSLESSPSTIALAKQVVAMDDEVDIEGWADMLAGDLGKGKD